MAGRQRVFVQPVHDGLFLATVLTVTFDRLQWELAGSLALSDVLTAGFVVLFAWIRLEPGGRKADTGGDRRAHR